MDILAKETQQILDRSDLRQVINDAIDRQGPGDGRMITIQVPETPPVVRDEKPARPE